MVDPPRGNSSSILKTPLFGRQLLKPEYLGRFLILFAAGVPRLVEGRHGMGAAHHWVNVVEGAELTAVEGLSWAQFTQVYLFPADGRFGGGRGHAWELLRFVDIIHVFV